MITCSGQMVTVGVNNGKCDTEDQTPPSGCQATVGQARACFDAFSTQTDAELCAGMVPPSCAPILACQQGVARTAVSTRDWLMTLAARLR